MQSGGGYDREPLKEATKNYKEVMETVAPTEAGEDQDHETRTEICEANDTLLSEICKLLNFAHDETVKATKAKPHRRERGKGTKLNHKSIKTNSLLIMNHAWLQIRSEVCSKR